MADRVLVIIPTYNESSNIPHLIPEVLDQDERIDVLIVDDNSPDGTGKIANQLASVNQRVNVLHRAEKSGLGTAYVTGFKWALERDYALIFEMDADFSHDPRHLTEFLATMAQEEVDLVLGSRYLNHRVAVVNWPITRLILSIGANAYARFVTGMKLADATGGFKCFRRKVLEAIDLSSIKSNGYAFQIEMSFRALRKGFRIKEIPIVFVDRADGTSKMSGAIVREAVWMVWRLRFQALFRKI
ncbi:MAG: polyprenol monophosphomannose synthase [Gemmatimonadetes bacterium]|nr:polyprenol monophosphomannose synthase [Gemmatimonadota bacterium]MCZ6916701.1 polyprenol monophosphomannose synthase [Gemmatimonadota bacterium]